MEHHYNESRQEVITKPEHIYAGHIDDIWNSQRYRPDLNYPLYICAGEDEDQVSNEFRLTLEQGRKVVGDLTRAIKEAEADNEKRRLADLRKCDTDARACNRETI